VKLIFTVVAMENLYLRVQKSIFKEERRKEEGRYIYKKNK